MSEQVTRRQFLGTGGKTAAGVAAGLTLHTLLREASAAEANEKFNVANLAGKSKYFRVVAIRIVLESVRF